MSDYTKAAIEARERSTRGEPEPKPKKTKKDEAPAASEEQETSGAEGEP
jgi:hypothetical protein